MGETTLKNAPVGKYYRISDLQSTPEVCHRLRELGFCEDAVIRCMSNSESHLICEVCNTRFGLNEHVAKDIVVVPFE